MSTRIERRFAELKAEGRAGLVIFVTAGDPDYQTALDLVKALPAAGADVIELGMPFTDPMADGPAIQASSLRALKSGQTMKKTLAFVTEFRAAKRLMLAEARRVRPSPGTLLIGTMLEVPALMWQLPDLLKEADFISIG